MRLTGSGPIYLKHRLPHPIFTPWIPLRMYCQRAAKVGDNLTIYNCWMSDILLFSFLFTELGRSFYIFFPNAWLTFYLFPTDLKCHLRTSLMVQGLPMEGSWVQSLVREQNPTCPQLKVHMLQLKTPHAANKTWSDHINKVFLMPSFFKYCFSLHVWVLTYVSNRAG